MNNLLSLLLFVFGFTMAIPLFAIGWWLVKKLKPKSSFAEALLLVTPLALLCIAVIVVNVLWGV